MQRFRVSNHRARVYDLRIATVLALALALTVGLVPITQASASPNGVVISEFQFRGPDGGNDEFVELLNTSQRNVDISGYSLQGCASSSGNPSNRATVPQGTTLQPGQHYLFTNGSGYSGSVSGDQTYGTGVSDPVSGNSSGARIVDPPEAIIDGVGSPNSPCREGEGLTTPTTNGDNAFERKSGGEQDTDDNAADFAGPKVGDPQNSGDVNAPPPDEPEEITPVHEIQGSGSGSPIAGEDVTVEAVVTGVDDEIGASFGSKRLSEKGC